ncbi:ParB/RepB/Spo0J family partition protein [Burkholderia multivorans]|uniref:ParB/RepB/Spo0J family partition protein n=1 Tax=Burkholderia multivorans TaxID=87883 RepID=UPI000B1B2036|nr:ParB/RepB/Spo0J family partition protein [Burkholderia multivorans]MCO1451079.1 ParB/RepB/Spo0J family partition protein [Burkholderia multivorans]MDN8103985.1 ParB/RepB/Spo0J family partition protein [Burkholderia multivorans]
MNQVADPILSAPVPYALGKINYIPLGQLCVSPRNVRKKAARNIPELANDIEYNGLLQNLVGHPIEAESHNAGTAPFGICAGQRRLAALNLLKSKGGWTDADPVPVLIVSIGEALAISLAENKGREEMHLADQCAAYRELIAEGRSVSDIAARFSVSDTAVRRALKLANISPRLLEVFRDDGMKYEQACALALSDDHEQQERIWFDATQDWQRSPYQIRQIITQAEVNAAENPLALFVGLDSYEAAGGYVRRDLFSDNANTGYVSDLELLNRLAVEKLSAAADHVRAEGWSWVESTIRHDAFVTMRPHQLDPAVREFTKKEKAEYRKLEQIRDSAFEAFDAYCDAVDEGCPEDTEDEADRGDALERAAEEARDALLAYEKRLELWTDEHKAQAGALLWIDRAGRLQIRRGLVKQQATENNAHGQQDGSPSLAKKSKPVHSETLCARLTAHRTAAVQAELLKHPDVATAYLLYAMVPAVFHEQFVDQWRDYHALDASFRPAIDTLPRVADDMTDSAAWRYLDGEREKWASQMPRELRHLLPWLLRAPAEVTAGLLTFCVAAMVDSVTRENKAHAVNSLADVLALDMVQYWKPTRNSYLNHVSKQRIVEVMSEAVSPTAAAPLAAMKKADAAAAAEMQVVETGWLPDVLTNRASTFPIENPAVEVARETSETAAS